MLNWINNIDSDSKSEEDSKEKITIKEILEGLSNPLVPIRAHALVSLRKMVLSKDSITTKNLDKILNIFVKQLFDSDR